MPISKLLLLQLVDRKSCETIQTSSLVPIDLWYQSAPKYCIDCETIQIFLVALKKHRSSLSSLKAHVDNLEALNYRFPPQALSHCDLAQ